ncbi:MAG: hypothetical protein JRJ23_04285 [Deltaproteobacteria bacterium]|nr:hypothetical protein [Deltaproteobacteria bacterium]
MTDFGRAIYLIFSTPTWFSKIILNEIRRIKLLGTHLIKMNGSKIIEIRIYNMIATIPLFHLVNNLKSILVLVFLSIDD